MSYKKEINLKSETIWFDELHVSGGASSFVKDTLWECHQMTTKSKITIILQDCNGVTVTFKPKDKY